MESGLVFWSSVAHFLPMVPLHLRNLALGEEKKSTGYGTICISPWLDDKDLRQKQFIFDNQYSLKRSNAS